MQEILTFFSQDEFVTSSWALIVNVLLQRFPFRH